MNLTSGQNRSDTQVSPASPQDTVSSQGAVRVLMIGCGRMGGALLSRWCTDSRFQFIVVSPSGSRELPRGVDQVRGAGELAAQRFDMVVLAVKPQMITEVLPDYLPLLADDGILLSIAAGFSLRSLNAIAGPATVVRVMPNLPVSLGKGVSGLFADDQVSGKHRQLTEALMQSTGHLIWVASEDELDRVTAVAGSGPGYAFEIARCWAQAGEDLGFSRSQARELVLRTLEGAIELALDSGAPLDGLREQVTSKNGTTQAGLSALNGQSQLDGLLSSTVRAAYERAIELR